MYDTKEYSCRPLPIFIFSTLTMASVRLSRLIKSAGSSILRRSLSTTTREPCSTVSPAATSGRGSPARARNPIRSGGGDLKRVQWVFLGCPGVGKGTYASRLSQLVGVPHIATGDLVRDELAFSGPLADKLTGMNHGHLVPDEIIFDLLSKRLEDGEAKGESGFILDGFPRTIRQAEILEGVANVDLVINLKLREDALLAKCLGRRICNQCGGNFNVTKIDIKGENGTPGLYMPPLLPPTECMSKLITRPDDNEEVVKERLHIYQHSSQPVEEFYRGRGKLLQFDLPGGIPESWPKLLQALDLEDTI